MHAALQAFSDSTWERKFGGLVEQASQVGFAPCCSQLASVRCGLIRCNSPEGCSSNSLPLRLQVESNHPSGGSIIPVAVIGAHGSLSLQIELLQTGLKACCFGAYKLDKLFWATLPHAGKLQGAGALRRWDAATEAA